MIPKRQKITLAVPFAVFTPNNVRYRRIFHLYRHLAQDFNIEIVSLAGAGEPAFHLKKSAKSANFVITYQPYLFPAIREVSNKPVWYKASGIERELKKQPLPENELGQEFWEAVCEVKGKCAKFSNLIITSSQHDAHSITQFQDVDNRYISLDCK